jgi:hypothetical protein
MRIKINVNFKISIIILSSVSILIGTALTNLHYFVGTSDIILDKKGSGVNKVLNHQLTFDVSLEVIKTDKMPLSKFEFGQNAIYQLNNRHLLGGYIIEVPDTDEDDNDKIMRKTLYLYTSEFTRIKRLSMEKERISGTLYTVEKGIVSREGEDIMYTHVLISGSNCSWLVVANYAPEEMQKAQALIESIQIVSPMAITAK